MATQTVPASDQKSPQNAQAAKDSTKPAAMAIPKEGYFKLTQGRYGPTYPRSPANYGFTIIARIIPGREQIIRGYGNQIEETIGGLPDALRSTQASLFTLGPLRHRQ